ncbi:MAG: hypothetical protein KC620_20930 [Myxococcales bacterium]|nr:hypothetical protein [Myxococcales bacterium]
MSPEDARFVDRLRRAYAPPPVDAARFDARLAERREALDARRRRAPLAWGGALMAAAATAFALYALRPNTPDPAREETPAPIAVDWLAALTPPATSDPFAELRQTEPLSDIGALGADEDDWLPADYEPLAVLVNWPTADEEEAW